MEMDTATVVFQHDFDEKTLEEFESLRLIRLSLAERLLSNPEKTINELLRRGLIAAKDKEKFRAELEGELAKKIKVLRDRSKDKKTVFADEIKLYSDILQD